MVLLKDQPGESDTGEEEPNPSMIRPSMIKRVGNTHETVRNVLCAASSPVSTQSRSENIRLVQTMVPA